MQNSEDYSEVNTPVSPESSLIPLWNASAEFLAALFLAIPTPSASKTHWRIFYALFFGMRPSGISFFQIFSCVQLLSHPLNNVV